ncbi:ABC transporter ATP-binding protein [Cohnella nanjingensis]|uniref:ABC transporter ATP-binding protein n=1 Tax=Cohnella nanjingensis TaxID=1387779 RepID=A0A7X0RWY5_9BACL|nr:ABC transporter ATP-binding protein [Cohnella nanjingensis]MBB6675197.1 ABC transporter ATP-binding protein [Cohnella nanjingensis]
MSTIVKVDRLTKSYKDIDAVKDVSFTLEENKIYGMLGRNGAGKTTIMHLLTAQIFPTGGDIQVFGEAPYENDRVLSRICFIKESQKYPTTFAVRDVLEVAAGLFPKWDREFAYSLVEDFRLPLKRKMTKLSRGMLSAVGIIVGLASRAPLTIFDEPYLGLDAVARSLFYDRLLEDYAEHPRTIVLSTHLIDEVSRMLEHVILIDGGKLLLDEEAEQLQGRAYTVVGSSSKVESFAAGKRVLARESMGGLTTVTVMGGAGSDDRKQALTLGLEMAPVTLQQLVVHLTGGKPEHKEAKAQ